MKFFITLLLITSTTLTAEVKILAFAGSSREGSYNKQLINDAVEIAKQSGGNVTLVDLKDFPMPIYDADLEQDQGLPESAKRLRALMIGSQVIMIASPEYNGSLSSLLKNTLDWVSRGEEKSANLDAYKGKKFLLMSASPGQGGGVRGLKHLSEIITNLGGEVMPIQTVIPSAQNAFDAQGHLKNPDLKKKLTEEVQSVLGKKA